MIEGYVLIVSDLGTVEAIIKEIDKIPAVKEPHHIYGIYDLLLRVEPGTSDELKELIDHKIREIRNITSKLTIVIIDNNVI